MNVHTFAFFIFICLFLSACENNDGASGATPSEPLTVDRDFNDELALSADPTVLLSILTNILNNVMEHGADNMGEAKARVRADRDSFSVSNMSTASSGEHAGERFGLEIVEQLCRVMKWRFSIEENEIDNETVFSIRVML